MLRLILFALCFLISCEYDTTNAPVKESHWLDLSHETSHTVQDGETLFSIAFKYEKDYENLAKINKIYPPYDVNPGQIIKLKHNTDLQPETLTKKYTPKPKQEPFNHKITFTNHWVWPVKGQIIQNYNPQIGNKGLKISTSYGNNVVASAPGTVVYAGNGLLGYGKLIIIKHNNIFLSAYGNNSQILVKEGDLVDSNSIIAKTGKLDTRRSGIHFEIRKNGKPINPKQFIR